MENGTVTLRGTIGLFYIYVHHGVMLKATLIYYGGLVCDREKVKRVRETQPENKQRGERIIMGSLGEINIENDIQSWSSNMSPKLPLLSLNHVSFVCESVRDSVRFYEDVLGFFLIKRPSSFDFEGAWLFNYGIGIHLLESSTIPRNKGKKINPKDNHISFQCTDMKLVIQKLEEINIEYVTAIVEEGGVIVDQLFFHDPDGYMIEICNCQNLPVLPLSSCPLKIPRTSDASNMKWKSSSLYGKRSSEMHCSGEAATVTMMENLLVEMMNISI